MVLKCFDASLDLGETTLTVRDEFNATFFLDCLEYPLGCGGLPPNRKELLETAGVMPVADTGWLWKGLCEQEEQLLRAGLTQELGPIANGSMLLAITISEMLLLRGVNT